MGGWCQMERLLRFCWGKRRECREIETGISVTNSVKANHASFHLASHKNILGSAFHSTRPLQHHFQETLRRIMYSSGISGKNIMIFCGKIFHAEYQRNILERLKRETCFTKKNIRGREYNNFLQQNVSCWISKEAKVKKNLIKILEKRILLKI